MNRRFPELGFYALPGFATSPKSIFEEVSSGDELGLGSVWISERFNNKDIGVMSGIAAARSPNMGIVSGLVGNLTLRNPLTLASYGSTMMSVTDGRFALGIGRGLDSRADRTGTKRLTFTLLTDYVDILRRMWNGEFVHYDGELGTFTGAGTGLALATRPPIIMAAMGDRTCEWAGQVCDGVLFNSMWSPAAIARSTKIVKAAAERAGRDPAEVKIWTIQVTACETSEEDVLNYVIRRMNTYLLFPAMFDLMCEHNGWDPAHADKLRAVLRAFDRDAPQGASGDEHTTRDIDELRRMRDLYPDHWIDEGSAVGTAGRCARLTRQRFDAGADGVLLHGSPPDKLDPLLDAWPAHRPDSIPLDRSVTPGL